MSRFPCPQCGVERQSLEADCTECGWSAAPQRTFHEVYVPRRLSKSELLVVLVAAIFGGLLGALRGGFVWGPQGALFVAPICIAYLITIVVLALELIAAFSQPIRRPQFSLRSMFVFTSLWAVLLFLAQMLSVRNLERLYTWPMQIAEDRNRLLVMVPIWFLALSWCFTVPAGLAYNAIGLTRNRPAPIFAYVFLTSALGLMTLLIPPLVGAKGLPGWRESACSFIMICAATGFVIESLVRKCEPAHRRRSMIAALISLQSYFALIWLFSALSGLAAV